MTRRQASIRTVVAAIALLGCLAVPASAQQQAPAPAGADVTTLEQGTPTAAVMVDGALVLRVRGVSSFPAEQRASVIAGRIRDLARNPAVRPESLRLEETDVAIQIMADRHLVMGVYDADAVVEGVPRKVLATLNLTRIQSAIVAYRADRTAPALRRAAIAAAIATLVFVALVFAIIWLRRRLDALLDRRYGQKIETLAAKSQDVVSVKRLWAFLDASLRFIRSAAIVALALGYLQDPFGLFPHTRPFARSVSGT